MQCIMYTEYNYIYCTLYDVKWVLYNVHCTLYTILNTEHQMNAHFS